MKKETKLWLDYANESYEDALYNWKGHRYGNTAFCCEQAVEKIIKALIVERKNIVPRKSHDLLRLLEDSEILPDIPKKWISELKEMERHYYQVRYPDLNKRIYSKRENVAKIVIATKEIYKWLLKKLEE